MTCLLSQSSRPAGQGLGSICLLSQAVFFPLRQLPQWYGRIEQIPKQSLNGQPFNIYNPVLFIKGKRNEYKGH